MKDREYYKNNIQQGLTTCSECGATIHHKFTEKHDEFHRILLRGSLHK